MAARTALLDAGLRLFADHPVAAVSIQDITDEADVAKGVFYLHFPNRAAYLLAVFRLIEKRLLSYFTRENGQCTAEAIAARGYARFLRDDRKGAIIWWRFSVMLPDEPGGPADFLTARASFDESLTALLFPAHSLRQRSSAAVRRRAATIDAIVWGLISRALQRRENGPDERTLREALSGSIAIPRAKPAENPVRAAGRS